MNSPELKVFEDEQLVELFTKIALNQFDALELDETNKFNQLYDQMEHVKSELKGRVGDQRLLLLPLLEHPNAQVRLKSAIATLALAPDDAMKALQRISDEDEYPQAAYARGMIDAVKEGRVNPS
jgi:Domain of unknown function (DUF2019)